MLRILKLVLLRRLRFPPSEVRGVLQEQEEIALPARFGDFVAPLVILMADPDEFRKLADLVVLLLGCPYIVTELGV